MKRKSIFYLAGIIVFVVAFGFASNVFIERTQAVPANPSIDDVVRGLKGVATASIADAVDEVVGERGFMSHDMRPIFNCKMAGRAVTAVIRASTKAKEQASPHHMLEVIDEGAPGSILVVKVEESLDIAGIGGLMANGCKARDFAGAVIDGSARDAQEIEDMGFPCFARGYTPATSVGRYRSVAKNVPIKCAGVVLRPGDIIVGDRDGVVVVPVEKAAEILELARSYEKKEKLMVPLIWELKSIMKAVAKYKRM